MKNKFLEKMPEQSYCQVESCPCCKSNGHQDDIGVLSTKQYYWEGMSFPAYSADKQVHIKYCPLCGLNYKDLVPEPEYLARLMEKTHYDLWKWNTDYLFLTNLLKTLFPYKGIRLLDVGAHNGTLLTAMSNIADKLSAMDIYFNHRCNEIVNDKYHISRLDDYLSFDDEYDVITMFDVIEHLYDPNKGFLNLSRLVKPGGFLIIETGDADKLAINKKRLIDSWYLCRPEHHMAFTRKTFSWLAASFGFQIISMTNKCNKDFAAFPPVVRMRKQILRVIFHLSPRIYRKIRQVMNQPPVQPPSMYTADHILVVLRKSGVGVNYR